jgi:Ribbon-helix-helix protein, copG family
MTVDDQRLARELYERRSDPDEWEDTPTEVKVQPARNEVVSFRLPSDQLNLIEELAAQAGQSVSEFLRNVILAYVRGETMTPVLDVQAGGSGRLQLTIRTWLPGSGHTYTDPADWIPDEPFRTVTCLD